MKRLLPWLVVAACACSNDLNALYAAKDAGANRAAGKDAGTTDSNVASDAGDIFSNIDSDDCRACLRAQCADVERTCLDQPSCAREARCEAGCRDPACIAHCQDPDSFWDPSQFVWDCKSASCNAECAVGRDFACLGQFDWPKVSSTITARVLALLANTGATPVEGVEVRACNYLGSCDGASSGTDAAGQVELEVPSFLQIYLEANALDFNPMLVYPGNLVPPSPRIGLAMVTPDMYAGAFTLNGYTDDPAFGGFYVWVLDCRGDRAPDLSLRPLPAPGPLVGLNRDSPPSSDGNNTWYGYPPDVKKTRTGADGLGGIVLVPEGQVELTAVKAGTEDVVARTRAESRPGTRTWVALYPLDKSQL